jgi:RNA polymerase sigma-70 factor (ECF subfamily)
MGPGGPLSSQVAQLTSSPPNLTSLVSIFYGATAVTCGCICQHTWFSQSLTAIPSSAFKILRGSAIADSIIMRPGECGGLSLVKNVIASDTKGEADLVRLIMAGDQLAEMELVQRYSRGMSIIIRHRVTNAADVEDLCQETFRTALEKIRRGDVREPERLSGFICALARNLAIGHLRQLSRWGSGNADAHSPIDHAPNPYDKLLSKERVDIVRQVINEMRSERDRQVLYRSCIMEQDKEKICADLGLTSLHFNRVLSRALKRFKEQYEKKFDKNKV